MMSESEICDLIYDEIEIVHNDYEIAETRVFIEMDANFNHIINTIVKYYKDNKLYRKIFRNKLIGDVDDE